ncbi:glycosyltransferase [Telmatobacter bradus]|uniref:glycosyltransferase n=1 Tax=Telmatobacter bradus TaxID=474953 RepID=UPI003B42B265
MNHIAFLIPGIDRVGGAERQALLLARGMRRRGWRVSLIALTGSGGTAGWSLMDAGVDFYTLEMRKGVADPRGWIRLLRWLRTHRPDVVHAHLPHATWMARWSHAALPWLHMVDTLHSSSTGSWLRHLGYRLSDWLAGRVTAVSEPVAQAHLARELVNPNKISIVPNGIDTRYFRPDESARRVLRMRLGLDDDFLFVATGRLEEVKNYPLMLAAMARMKEPARLLIVGEGSQQQAIEEQIRVLGLRDRVEMVGFSEDVRSYLQAADGFLLTSHWEGLPMGVLEAASCGLPTVAVDVPGLRDAIRHGVTGWLNPSADPELLAASMSSLVRLPLAMRRTMGQHARQFVTERYGIESVLDRWETLYRLCQLPHPALVPEPVLRRTAPRTSS